MQGRWVPRLKRESYRLVLSKLVTWSPVSACHMGIILPHLPLEAVPLFNGGTLSSAVVWTWMNEAAQQSREPGRPEPQRYPCTPPTPSLASVGSNEERNYPLPLSLAHSFSIDFYFNKQIQTCSGCCGVRDAREMKFPRNAGRVQAPRTAVCRAS